MTAVVERGLWNQVASAVSILDNFISFPATFVEDTLGRELRYYSVRLMRKSIVQQFVWTVELSETVCFVLALGKVRGRNMFTLTPFSCFVLLLFKHGGTDEA